jgi:hypothetical protein
MTSSKQSLVKLAGMASLTVALAGCGGGKQEEPASDPVPAAGAPASAPAALAVDKGTTVTEWAAEVTRTKPAVTPGTWRAGVTARC